MSVTASYEHLAHGLQIMYQVVVCLPKMGVLLSSKAALDILMDGNSINMALHWNTDTAGTELLS